MTALDPWAVLAENNRERLAMQETRPDRFGPDLTCPDCGAAVDVSETMEPGATGKPVTVRQLYMPGENEPHVCEPAPSTSAGDFKPVTAVVRRFGGLTVEDVPRVRPYAIVMVELELVDGAWRIWPGCHDGEPLDCFEGDDDPTRPELPTLDELHRLIGGELHEVRHLVDGDTGQ